MHFSSSSLKLLFVYLRGGADLFDSELPDGPSLFFTSFRNQFVSFDVSSVVFSNDARAAWLPSLELEVVDLDRVYYQCPFVLCAKVLVASHRDVSTNEFLSCNLLQMLYG